MRRIITLILALMLLLAAVSCGKSTPPIPCREILLAMADAEPSLPAGRFYSLSAAEGESEYLSDSLLRALYGEHGAVEGWLDCALYLSVSERPCELAVILCRDHDTASDTARLFGARLGAIRITVTDPDYGRIVTDAKVTVLGNYVLFLVSSDSEAVLQAAKDVIRGSR